MTPGVAPIGAELDGVVALGVVSPHLDDAVLSCAQVLGAHPGSVVVTVFSGGPGVVDPLPPWDESAGFGPGDDVTAARRHEDEAALAALGARAVHLGLWDHQYRNPSYGYEEPAGGLDEAVDTALAAAIGAHDSIATWLVPLGILHPDHRATAAAALRLARRRPELGWLVYEELPYHVAYGREAAKAAARLEQAGFTLEHVAPGTGPAPATGPSYRQVGKVAAIRCYASQVPALGEGVDQAVAGPEVLHRLVDAG